MIRAKYIVSKLNESLEKEFVRELWDGTKIYFVNGNYVRNNYYLEFNLGGHGYIDKFIPGDEIWIEKTGKRTDIVFNTTHEIVEYILMKYAHVNNYDIAHDISVNVERVLREIFINKIGDKDSEQ